MLSIQKQLINYNYSPRTEKIKYIVIHDVGSVSSAQNNRDYFAGGDRNASADFFVDSNNIIQIIDYKVNYSWAIGDGRGKYGKTNGNSLSIEMCLESNRIPSDKTIQNTIDLVKYLMSELNIAADCVVRHKDCSDKLCPQSFSANNWEKWNWFKAQLVDQPKQETPIPSPTPQPQPVQTTTRTIEGVGYCTVNVLNVRNGAGTNYARQGELNMNEKITILEKNGDWRKVRYYNANQGCTMTGWVNANYLRISQDVQVIVETIPQSDAKYGTVVATALNIRSGRGTGFGVIGQLKQGDKVKLLYLKDNWWSIDVPMNISSTGIGFVSADYVK